MNIAVLIAAVCIFLGEVLVLFVRERFHLISSFGYILFTGDSIIELGVLIGQPLLGAIAAMIVTMPFIILYSFLVARYLRIHRVRINFPVKSLF